MGSLAFRLWTTFVPINAKKLIKVVSATLTKVVIKVISVRECAQDLTSLCLRLRWI